MVEMTFAPTKPWHETTAQFAELLDRTYKAKKDAEPRREYVGASLIGHHCDRFLGYSYHGTPRDEGKGFSGQTYRIFDMGHDGEARMADYLRIAGFELRTERSDGYQFGFAGLGGKIKGHIDGIIDAGPVALMYPIGWENKAVGQKSFNEFVNNGVRKAKPLYYGQCQMLMAYMALGAFLFTAINRDTGELYAEVVPFDGAEAQRLSDRALKVVRTNRPEELVRCTADKADFRCKFCDYSTRCWSQQEAPVAATPRPAWLR